MYQCDLLIVTAHLHCMCMHVIVLDMAFQLTLPLPCVQLFQPS